MPENPMPDSFIVTVVSEMGNFEADIEIPSRLTFGEMKGKLLEILKTLNEDKFRGWRGCSLRYKGRFIAEDKTLAAVGAFDGSKLIIEPGP